MPGQDSSPANFSYGAYRFLTGLSAPALSLLLSRRLANGKEIAERIEEKKGRPGRARPPGMLAWIHAASVGEVQSALILIRRLCAAYPDLRILVTTGTVTSARIVEDKLPAGAVHQFYPLDHPRWTDSFLNHWRPDLVFWMESELWPNMLEGLRMRNIPAILVNARLSPRSLRSWRRMASLAARMLSSFRLILAQTADEARRFQSLGFTGRAVATDNLKYSAMLLPFDEAALDALRSATDGRALWVFASTHKGEESLAARVHAALTARFPNLLTVIVPRHPERREEIAQSLRDCGLALRFRGERNEKPQKTDELYIADTLGELGLFYRLCPIACIGRSFSDDGGGGHNPLEAAQLHCAVLHGPNVQNLQPIYDEMDAAGAAVRVENETAFAEILAGLLSDNVRLRQQQHAGAAFAQGKADVIGRVMAEVAPILAALLPECAGAERTTPP